AALYRSFGKTSTTMYLSIASNVINVVGNCIGVFALHTGVPGVAVPSLIARIFSAAVITVLCFSKRNPVQYLKEWIFKVDLSFQKTILSIAVPNGIESGIFQLVKVALSSVVALFGTYQIAANGIAQSIWSMAALTSSALSPVFITVIGQCMGAGDTDQAEYYFRKLIKITLIIGVAWNALVFAVTPFVLSFYAVSEETKRLTLWLVLLHNRCKIHNGNFPLHDHRRPPDFLCDFCNLDEHGRYGNRSCDVPRLVRARHHLLVEIQTGQVENVSGYP
ncbi:MAG TPA: MATE family efflux transporter, partial [Fusicatenibacter saccharivorans]|nr:MATE family efflux transporter [Fusicatenibacter saccharivorans]